MTATSNKPAAKPATNKPAATAPATGPATADNKSAPRTRKPAVAVDFGSLTIEDAPAPARSGPGGSTWTPNESLLSALRASWAARSVSREYRTDGVVTKTTYTGSGKAITVADEGQADTLVNAIRKHADFLGHGVTIKVEQMNGKFRVSFAAKTPKERKAK